MTISPSSISVNPRNERRGSEHTVNNSVPDIWRDHCLTPSLSLLIKVGKQFGIDRWVAGMNGPEWWTKIDKVDFFPTNCHLCSYQALSSPGASKRHSIGSLERTNL